MENFIFKPSSFCQSAITGSTRLMLARKIHTLIQRGEVLKFKKCKFQASVLRIDSLCDVEEALKEVRKDKKVQKATHPHIAAWSVNGETGFSDCGEAGAGKRLLRLLEAKRIDNTVLCVTRWYGGKHLGSARFRIISRAGKELLERVL